MVRVSIHNTLSSNLRRTIFCHMQVTLLLYCALAVATPAVAQSDECPCTVGPSGRDEVADCDTQQIGDELPDCLPANVTILRLSGNLITQLDNTTFASLPDLMRVELYMNQISSVAADTFVNNPAVIQVFLNINNLTELLPGTFSYTPLLNSLYLDYNNLTQLDGSIFYNNTELTYLSAEYNLLTSLDRSSFAEVPSLRYLLLCGNRLEYVAGDAFADLPLLRELHLCENSLVQLEPGLFSPLPQLTILWLGSNSLVDLPLDAFVNGSSVIEYVFVENNALQALDAALVSGWPRLLGMRLYGNPWLCDCSLQPAVQWLSSQLWAGVPSGYCAAPPELQGQLLADAVPPLCCGADCNSTTTEESDTSTTASGQP
ncbi:leucine-rich repeat-containing protein 15-like [Schistocerca gregaria]|uniref:leucine-rich repeat-containing protein 15-like n=1 Tax=Schistocerca gregaria TaxID=7010 RepID=UPI00211E4F66|nr:leucine-rich repeat-containing protein 15-like [Schistocerca gregaria]